MLLACGTGACLVIALLVTLFGAVASWLGISRKCDAKDHHCTHCPDDETDET